ncbi:MAG: RNA-binding cell elongation regulator Jag/EloR [Pseudomonadota bacterium]
MEFTGKTVKDAIARACEELEVDEALLEVEVLEESARGFLGLVGHRNARVRVRKRNILKEAMEFERPESHVPSEDTHESTEIESVAKSRLEAVQTITQEDSLTESIDKSEISSRAKELLEGILSRIPVEAAVEVSVANGCVELEITGDRSGLLIGKRGQTLDALQYILNKSVNRETPLEEKTEIIVDTEDYRRRKQEILRDMALRMSQKAKKSLKPAALNPMPANERRIIHMILSEDKEVYTKSYGEGPLRRIIVYPRRAMPNKRRRR